MPYFTLSHHTTLTLTATMPLSLQLSWYSTVSATTDNIAATRTSTSQITTNAVSTTNTIISSTTNGNTGMITCINYNATPISITLLYLSQSSPMKSNCYFKIEQLTWRKVSNWKHFLLTLLKYVDFQTYKFMYWRTEYIAWFYSWLYR